MKTPRLYYGALAVFCVIALCTGFASAQGAAQATDTSTHGKGIVHQGFDLTNTTVQQQMLTRYAKQGVDTTGLAAAFQSGNTTDVKSWLEAHRPAAPGLRRDRSGKRPIMPMPRSSSRSWPGMRSREWIPPDLRQPSSPGIQPT